MGGHVKKRHHFVPRAYLRRWAASEGQVLIRRRGADRVITTNVSNVAVEGHLYRLVGLPEGEGWLEDQLSELEQHLPAALDGLVANGRPVDQDHRGLVSMLLAMQFARTPAQLQKWEFAEALVQYAGTEQLTSEAVRAYLRDHHLKFEPSDGEVAGALDFARALLAHGLPSKAELYFIAFNSASEHFAPVIAGMSWSVERCRKPRLITSDAPLSLWRPPSPEDKFKGFGIMDAEELRFPLDPSHLLVLRHAGREDSSSVHARRGVEVSLQIARSCDKTIVGSSRQGEQLASMPMARHRPRLRFNLAPGYVADPAGEVRHVGDVIHTWVQHRDEPVDDS